jgi:hypothetical protein
MFKKLTNQDLVRITLLLGEIFFPRIPALAGAACGSSMIITLNRCIEIHAKNIVRGQEGTVG